MNTSVVIPNFYETWATRANMLLEANGSIRDLCGPLYTYVHTEMNENTINLFLGDILLRQFEIISDDNNQLVSAMYCFFEENISITLSSAAIEYLYEQILLYRASINGI